MSCSWLCALRTTSTQKEEVDFAEFHVLMRPGAVAIVCQDGTWIDGTDGLDPNDERALLPGENVLAHGAEAVIYRLIDAIVDGYSPVLQGIAVDKEQIERQVFSGDATVAERIYRLSLEVIDVQHTTSALAEVIDALHGGFGKYGVTEHLQTYLQDVSDHLTRANTLVLEYRTALLADPRRQCHARRAASERGYEEDIRMGGDPLRTDAHRRGVRHELRRHARAALGFRLSRCRRPYGAVRRGAVRAVQVAEVDVMRS